MEVNPFNNKILFDICTFKSKYIREERCNYIKNASIYIPEGQEGKE